MTETLKTSPRQVGGGTGRKQKVKRGVSLLLIAALLITGALAFLTATDSKTNVFTIGNVDINLYEDDWYDHDSGEVLDDENDNGVPDFAEDIVPGQEIDKAPYVENTGSNEAWVYMTVSVPTANRADLENPGALNKVINENVSGVQIQVNAYAIQDKYEGKTTAREVWDAYVGTSGEPAAIDYTGMFGAATIPTNDRVELFEIVGLDVDRTESSATPGEPDVTVDGNWVLLDTYYGADGNNYYVYALKEKLAAEDDASTVDTVEDKTSELFTSVKLSDKIGAPPAVSVPEGTIAFNFDDPVNTGYFEENPDVQPLSLNNSTQYIYLLTDKTRIRAANYSQLLTVDESVYSVSAKGSKNAAILGSGAQIKLTNIDTQNVDYVYIVIVAGDVSGEAVVSNLDTNMVDVYINGGRTDERWGLTDSTTDTAEQKEFKALARAARHRAADIGSATALKADGSAAWSSGDGAKRYNADGIIDSSDLSLFEFYILTDNRATINYDSANDVFYTLVSA